MFIIHFISHVKNKTLFSFIFFFLPSIKRFLPGGAWGDFTVFGPHNYYLLPINVKISPTALCWKENLSLDRPFESINKLSISLQIQAVDLIHFNKGNVHKGSTIFGGHFWPPLPPKIIYAHYLCTFPILYQQRV